MAASTTSYLQPLHLAGPTKRPQEDSSFCRKVHSAQPRSIIIEMAMESSRHLTTKQTSISADMRTLRNSYPRASQPEQTHNAAYHAHHAKLCIVLIFLRLATEQWQADSTSVRATQQQGISDEDQSLYRDVQLSGEMKSSKRIGVPRNVLFCFYCDRDFPNRSRTS